MNLTNQQIKTKVVNLIVLIKLTKNKKMIDDYLENLFEKYNCANIISARYQCMTAALEAPIDVPFGSSGEAYSTEIVHDLVSAKTLYNYYEEIYNRLETKGWFQLYEETNVIGTNY